MTRRKTMPPKGAAVSNAELVLARLCAEGHPDKVIADRMGLGIKTVRQRRDVLRAKLGLQSKAAVAAWWVEAGKPEPRPTAAPALPVQRSPRVFVRMSDYVEARGIG